MTIFSYLKSNAAIWDETHNKLGWGIKAEKQAQMFYSTLIVAFVVCSMLGCMVIQIVTGTDELTFPHDFSVFYVKFPCAIALHFCLYPEVAKGMELMKFANNHPELFVPGGSEISYFIACIQVFCSVLAEVINITLLTNQHTVDHCIIHFVALEVIMEVSSLYYESLMHNKLTQILHHPPKISNHNRDLKFAERSVFHKFARIFFKAFRALYVGVIFYFVPFTVIYSQWMLKVSH